MGPLVGRLADPNPIFGFQVYSAPILSQRERAANFWYAGLRDIRHVDGAQVHG